MVFLQRVIIIKTMNNARNIFGLVAVFLAATANAGTVANTLYLEARGEGERGVRAVASVIYNRSISTGKDFESVCLKPFQFSCWNGSKTRVITPKTDLDKKAYKLCLQVEKELLEGNFKPLGEWTHYFNARVCNPKWAAGIKQTKIGNHNFLKTK